MGIRPGAYRRRVCSARATQHATLVVCLECHLINREVMRWHSEEDSRGELYMSHEELSIVLQLIQSRLDDLLSRINAFIARLDEEVER